MKNNLPVSFALEVGSQVKVLDTILCNLFYQNGLKIPLSTNQRAFSINEKPKAIHVQQSSNNGFKILNEKLNIYASTFGDDPL